MNDVAYTLHRDGTIKHWPSPGDNIGVWMLVNDTTGLQEYFASWEPNIFIEITSEQFHVLAQRMGIPELQ